MENPRHPAGIFFCRGAATRGPITDGAARSAVRVFLRSKNLGAGGIHFRRACKIDRVPAEAELLWDRPHRGLPRCYRHRGVIFTLLENPRHPAGIFFCPGAATRGPITDGAARSAVRVFLRSKNLGAGGIHFRRACKIDRVPAEAELLWDRPHRG